MKSCLIVLLSILFAIPSYAQSVATEHQVVILGNIADVTEHGAFIQKLETRFNSIKSPFTVLLNGDIADNSVTDGGDQLALTKKIMSLGNTMSLGNLIILPGDRDWNNSGKGGLKNVLLIETEIKSYKEERDYDRVTWIIPNGCPGPFITEVNENLVFITINTQWWNHPYDKPRPADGICEIITHRDFMEELEDAVDEYKDKNVKAFFDTGRVYYDGAVNESNKWHMGYGGGIYVVPFKEAFMLSLSVGFSEEESFYPIIGFGVPLR